LVIALAVSACASTPTPTPPDPREVVARLETQRAEARALTSALRDRSTAARARAVLALGRLERLDAVDGIVAALADREPAVRVVAAFAAGQIDLAIDPRRASHETHRVSIESALLARLDTEQDATVRLALLRALGRVAARQGLKTLGEAAAHGPPAEKATALTALGVAGARRKASLSRDDDVRSAVEAGLRDGEPTVVEGAAYAAFRQRLPLSAGAVDAARRSPSAQARIFVARALPFVEPEVARSALEALVADEDWRVRVEATRSIATRHDLAVDRLPDVLNTAVTRARQPGEQHVVGEVCTALAAVGEPTAVRAVVAAAVAALPDDAADARCTCAGALAVLGGGGDALERCAASSEQRDRHVVEALARQRIPAVERLAALRPYVEHEGARVRIGAATAICSSGTVEAAGVAVERLRLEQDPGVVSALLECFADDAHADVLDDGTIAAAVARFVEAGTPEALDPLLVLTGLARKRPTLEPLVDSLKVHREARVRDAALDVPVGERTAGPRALDLPPPRPATLPLGAVLKTSRGEITIAFERELAPVAVRTFVQLAQQGIYRGTAFHRVIADFVAQGGDPRGDGSGGPGFVIPCENSDAPFTRGTIGIATAGKDTGGSQFFLVHSAQPHLDGRYTLFGRVVGGLEVMDALQRDDLLLDVEVLTALRTLAH
jgi:cyclophilin family peptidyl-prolyl cis-trans isomerase/HEAT repeat protein